MIFGGIQKTSTIDFPGVLACVLFTRGCNMDCFYCHNRDIISFEGASLPEEDIMAFLAKRRGVLEGVTISGGEPTLQKGLDDFLRCVKEMGYLVKLDTNGQQPEEVAILCREKLFDYVAVDLKALPADYFKITGKNGYDAAIETIRLLQESEVDFEVRTTLYPGMSIEKLQELMSNLPVMKLWRLNYFRMPLKYRQEDKSWLEQKSLTPLAVEGALPIFLKLQPNLA
jgi:pyruvate formate lyase activating enzyme